MIGSPGIRTPPAPDNVGRSETSQWPHSCGPRALGRLFSALPQRALERPGTISSSILGTCTTRRMGVSVSGVGQNRSCSALTSARTSGLLSSRAPSHVLVIDDVCCPAKSSTTSSSGSRQSVSRPARGIERLPAVARRLARRPRREISLGLCRARRRGPGGLLGRGPAGPGRQGRARRGRALHGVRQEGGREEGEGLHFAGRRACSGLGGGLARASATLR